MNYCILRAEKLTTIGSVAGSAKHTFREIPTPNADASRTHLNRNFGATSSAELLQTLKARLPEKRRKDAVLCIEYLVAASPEWVATASTQTKNQYFKGAVAWLEERHGKDNIICVSVQLDESNPHLAIYAVPITKDGRLSAKDFLGGRKVLSDMQTDFAAKVGAPVGLKRGIQGSKAKHTTAKQYAAALNKNPTLAALKPPAPRLVDRVTGRAKELEAKYKEEQTKHIALVEQAQTVAEVSRHSRARQAEALERLRQESDEREREAAQLRKENARLAREIQVQRTYFQRQIDDLKAQLAKALDQVKGFMQRIGLLTSERDRAEAEVEELREVLYPSVRRSDTQPGSY
ncbi:plasmid recombination protein [Massilia pinisoli]|uniref:Plasmid recombination protein n=1 Tax=Massilia pinisoli TaxID=1772194 RepID=A0ABT1ZZI9_9BURK|nr:MobV family relaxase [Massilia pinisoli]MCS0585343.1 plasmid recombination protein [Massilia pinisoli]